MLCRASAAVTSCRLAGRQAAQAYSLCWTGIRASTASTCYVIKHRRSTCILQPLPGTVAQATCMRMLSVFQAGGPGKRASPMQASWLAVGFGDGRVEVHELSSRFVHAVKDELYACRCP